MHNQSLAHHTSFLFRQHGIRAHGMSIRYSSGSNKLLNRVKILQVCVWGTTFPIGLQEGCQWLCFDKCMQILKMSSKYLDIEFLTKVLGIDRRVLLGIG